MNNQRRKRIQAVISRLEEVQNEISEILFEEQDYRDNMPESIADGYRGQKADQAIESLENAEQCTQETIDSLQGAAEQ